jgi:hypothetical protein
VATDYRNVGTGRQRRGERAGSTAAQGCAIMRNASGSMPQVDAADAPAGALMGENSLGSASAWAPSCLGFWDAHTELA